MTTTFHKRRRIPNELRLQLAARQRWCCATCQELLRATFQVDHIVPLHRGGSNEPHNLQVLCCQCHSIKSQVERIESLEWNAVSDVSAIESVHARKAPVVGMYRMKFKQRWPFWSKFVYPKLPEQEWYHLYCRFDARESARSSSV